MNDERTIHPITASVHEFFSTDNRDTFAQLIMLATLKMDNHVFHDYSQSPNIRTYIPSGSGNPDFLEEGIYRKVHVVQTRYLERWQVIESHFLTGTVYDRYDSYDSDGSINNLTVSVEGDGRGAFHPDGSGVLSVPYKSTAGKETPDTNDMQTAHDAALSILVDEGYLPAYTSETIIG